jgi:hypothetical protein
MARALLEYECRPRDASGRFDLSDGALTIPALQPLREVFEAAATADGITAEQVTVDTITEREIDRLHAHGYVNHLVAKGARSYAQTLPADRKPGRARTQAQECVDQLNTHPELQDAVAARPRPVPMAQRLSFLRQSQDHDHASLMARARDVARQLRATADAIDEAAHAGDAAQLASGTTYMFGDVERLKGAAALVVKGEKMLSILEKAP